MNLQTTRANMASKQPTGTHTPRMPGPNARRGESQSNNIYIYSCSKCHNEIGRGNNRWESLSRSYATPVSVDSTSLNDNRVNKEMQRAAVGSELEGWYV